jgi:hypothetical protein
VRSSHLVTWPVSEVLRTMERSCNEKRRVRLHRYVAAIVMFRASANRLQEPRRVASPLCSGNTGATTNTREKLHRQYRSRIRVHTVLWAAHSHRWRRSRNRWCLVHVCRILVAMWTPAQIQQWYEAVRSVYGVRGVFLRSHDWFAFDLGDPRFGAQRAQWANWAAQWRHRRHRLGISLRLWDANQVVPSLAAVASELPDDDQRACGADRSQSVGGRPE